MSMSKEKEVIDTKTLLTRFKRFGLKVPLEELNKIPEELQRQIYSDLGYFHKQMYNEIALKKETAYCYRQIGPNRILYIIVNHNRTTLLVRDSNIKKITQYISAKELDRFSKADRSILNALSNFNEQKDATLVHTVNELRRYIHISLNKNITRGSPKIVPKSLNGYQIDNDFEYDIPCLSEEEKDYVDER